MAHICIDIGNSCIKIGTFLGKQLKAYDVVDTHDSNALLRLLKKKNLKRTDKVLICSVVPSMTKQVKKNLRQICGVKSFVINEHIHISIVSRYACISSLGNDRLVNLYGALCITKSPFIIISFGTAITLDVVSKEGVHCGGYILPGLTTASFALNQATAALPIVVLPAVSGICGTDTKSCIQKGIIYGTASAVEGLIGRLKKMCGGKVSVVGVGNDAQLMKKYCRSITHVEQYHTIRTLNNILLSLG